MYNDTSESKSGVVMMIFFLFYTLIAALACPLKMVGLTGNYKVKDLFTSTFIVEYEDGIVLIDAGYDEEAEPILSFLEGKRTKVI